MHRKSKENRSGFGVFVAGSKSIVFVLAVAIGARAQDAPVRFQVAIGQTYDRITAICGKPFGISREDASGVNASIGVPLGLWSVYHLTPFEDRMYVSMAHFDTSNKVDALMLMPAGNQSVEQILRDHPLLAALCNDGCETVHPS